MMCVPPWNGHILSADKNQKLKSLNTDDFFKIKVTLQSHSIFAGCIQFVRIWSSN